MNVKKLISMVLALVMLLAMSTTAMAAKDTPHVITIDNTVADYEYEAYQVFKGNLSEEGDNKGQLQDIEWGNGVNATNLMTALKLIPEFEDCETAVDVANVLAPIAVENHELTQKFADAVAANLGAVAVSADSVTGDEGYKINVVGDGYYFVRTTKVPTVSEEDSTGVYTRYILKVVRNVTVKHKGDAPEVIKKIVDGEKRVDSTDVNIGDPVTFELTATLPSDYNLFKTYTVTFHDKLSPGLDLNADTFVVKVDGTPIANTLYTVNTAPGDGCSFDLVIANVKDTAAGNSSKIIVTYEATLNNDADIGMDGNPNTVYLEYSNNPNQEQGGKPETGRTPEDRVVVFTYELDVTKVDGADDEITLANAKFSLLNEDKTKIAKFNSENEILGWDKVSDVAKGENGIYPADYTLTTGDDGIIKVIGLDAGTYYLEETQAPAGYNPPANPFVIVITAKTTETEGADKVIQIESLSATIDGKNVAADKASGIITGTIVNQSGATLPETGAQGTKMLYIVGGILVAAAVVLLIVKRRMDSAE